ncbi:MAG: hypothetical protein LBN23_01175, partial [Paludibacter sp.]|nr:hypothetical protein [Paludibacter sp.]
MKHTLLTLIFAFCILHSVFAQTSLPPRQMEKLDRGLIAVKVTGGVYLSWRLFGNDDPNTIFKIYRGATLINTGTAASATNFSDTGGATTSKYTIAAYANGELIDSTAEASVWAQQYLTVNLNRPPRDTTRSATGAIIPNVTHPGTSNGTATN